MPDSSPTEAALDSALASALSNDREFASWFLKRTRFAAEEAECVLVRADNPWSRVTLRREDPNSGLIEELTRDCETDVLAVFEAPSGRRIALHIENKLANGSFTPLQPELYRDRLAQWQMKPRLGMYMEATSILIAPLVFYQRNLDAVQQFESYISHENIAEHLPAFRFATQPNT